MGCKSRDDVVQRIVELAVTAAFAAHAEMLPSLMREFALKLRQQWLDHYAGRYVPKQTKAYNALRNDRIRELARTGTPLDQLARDFHLTPGAVRRIVKTSDEPEPARSA